MALSIRGRSVLLRRFLIELFLVNMQTLSALARRVILFLFLRAVQISVLPSLSVVMVVVHIVKQKMVVVLIATTSAMAAPRVLSVLI